MRSRLELRRSMALAAVSVVLVLLLSSAATVAMAGSTSHCGSPTESYCIAGGRDYRGVLNTTSSGLTCQAWSSQTPWTHTEMHPDIVAGIGDHNYCRYMEALQTVGCYTTDPMVQVDTCDIGDVCDCPYPDKTILFAPPTGSLLVADGSANFVTLQCFPKPCDLYYTINGATPVLGDAIPYNGLGIMLASSTMVKALAIFVDGTLNRFATYAVEPQYTPDPSIKFVPSSDVVYNGPVLAHLEGLNARDQVLVFIGDAPPIAYARGDSFWVSNTSEVTAVINGTRTVTATYVIQSAAPTFAVYPTSGSFLGGVRVVIYAEGARELYAAVNGAAEERLASSTLLLSHVGLNVVTIRVVYLGGVVSQSVHRYEVLEALPPTMSPAHTQFSRPVNITCADPLARALAIGNAGGDGDDSSADEDATPVYELALTRPGTYTLNCTYMDNIFQTHSTTRVITLTALPLPAPSPTPACGLAFPNTPLFLQAQVVSAADGLTQVETTYTLDIRPDPNVSRVPFVEQLDRTHFAYALVPMADVGSATVSFLSASSDAMEAPSAALMCTYPIHSLADRQTPLHVARPVCPTFVDTAGGVVPAECVREIGFQLASCLHMYTTDLLSVHVYGPLLAIRVTQLPAVLEADMYQRVHACLVGANGTAASVNVTDVQGELERTIQLATGWRLVDGISVTVVDGSSNHSATTSLQQTISDASFLVRVTGINVSRGSYYFVREAHSCFDLGVPPSSTLLDDENYQPESDYTSSVSTLGAALAVFSVDVPGTYKLCARFGSAVYEVESIAPLTVTHRPWPTLAPLRADSCGGLVDTAFASAPLSVAFEAGPEALSPLFSDYWYSVDASASWQSKALGSAISLSPVQSFASPSRVVVASLGAQTGTHAACVFYAPAVNPAVNRSGITYRFYSKPAAMRHVDYGATVIAAANTTRDLVVILSGDFQITEQISLSLASPIWAVPLTDKVNISEATWVPRGETALSTSAAVNMSFAVPHEAIRVETSFNEDVWRVTVMLDGQAVTLSPSDVALSDLAAGMSDSSHCASGYQYADRCVCVGAQNKSAYLCGNATPDTPDIPDTSTAERLIMLILYLVIIAAIMGYIGFSIVKGEQNHVAIEEAEDIFIEDAVSAPAAPPHRASPPSDTMANRDADRGDTVAHSRRGGDSAEPAAVAPEDDSARGRSAHSREDSKAVEVNASNWF